MRLFLSALLVSCAAFAADAPVRETIDAFGMKWDVPVASEWSFDKGVLRVLKPRPQEKDPRRPVQFALARTQPFSELELEMDVKRDDKSIVIVYNWQKEGYFDYAHLSVDMPSKVAVHNGIFHCYGGDRVRISPQEGDAALPTTDWTPVRLVYTAKNGEVRVWANGKTTTALRGIDLSLGAGRFGLGSFFETGQFRNLKVKSKP